MSASQAVDRREILKTGVRGGAALILGFWLPKRGEAQTLAPATGGLYKANAWISIASDDRIALLTEIPEMGQGTRTANAMMLADELEADWSTISVEQAPTIPAVYKHLGTGGSGGTAGTWEPMRQAGAQARAMLLAAAAAQWNVPPSECQASNGSIIHTPTRRRLRYGELVQAASALLPIAPEQAPLKDPRNFRYIGKPMARVDTPSKVNGAAVFGIDAGVPGMLFAVIARCPHFGGELATCDDTQAKAVSGVRRIFKLPPIGPAPGVARDIHVAGGVCVVADSSWAAIEGRKALKLTWNKGPGGEESSASLRAAFEQQAAGPPTVVAVDRGDALKVLAQSAGRVESAYELPFQAPRHHGADECHGARAQRWLHRSLGADADPRQPGRRGLHPVGDCGAGRHTAGKGDGPRHVVRRLLRPPLPMGLCRGSVASGQGNEGPRATSLDARRRFPARFLPAVFLLSPFGSVG
jgi:isoquinoline 1-oxidoreductase subunit beta